MMAKITTSAGQQFPVLYRTARVNALEIFYREAGPHKAPGVLLLHGFPTSSNMGFFAQTPNNPST